MPGKIFGVISLISLGFGIINGRGEAMAKAALDGASDAVRLLLTLGGMMCLWCGILKVLEEAGVIRTLARWLRRPLGLFFPETARSGEGLEELCANIAANLLGVGNAATPMALAALRKMQAHSPDREVPSNDMITLTVLNTCPLTLVPSTLLALRQAAGAAAPFEVIVPIWISSLCCALFGLILCRLLGKTESSCRRKMKKTVYKRQKI